VTLTAASWFQAVNNALFRGIGLAGATTIASSTTPDIFAVTTSGVINYTGTETCTGFAAATQAGARRLLVCSGAAVFTAGANMLIEGVPSGNYTATADDKIHVLAMTTTQFHLTPQASALFTGTNQSLATNGYQKLPGGLIVQWGTTGSITGDTNNNAISFATAFPTACRVVVITASTQIGTGAGENFSAGIHTKSTTGFQINNDSQTSTFDYIALGY